MTTPHIEESEVEVRDSMCEFWYQKGKDDAVEKMKTDVSYIEYNLRQSIKHEREGTNLGKYKMDVDKYLNELHTLSSPRRHYQRLKSTTK